MPKQNKMTLAQGGIICQPGSTEKYKTGNWRNQIPLLNKSKCKSCLLCANFCPENCIKIKEVGIKENLSKEKVGVAQISHIDYYYCKGCGICAQECPEKAITMKTI